MRRVYQQRSFRGSLVMLGVGLATSFATASDIHVDDDAAPGGDGSVGMPYDSLVTALAAAFNGDDIIIAAGTYVAPSGGFFLKEGVDLFGVPGATILTADVNGDDLPGGVNRADNQLRVALALLLNTNTTLDGLTFTGGAADGIFASEREGAGLTIASSNVTLRDCLFTENHAVTGGGGVLVKSGNVTVEDCEFTNNSAVLGGGLSCQSASGSLTVDGCDFFDNHGVSFGGGMHFAASISPFVIDTRVINNTANAGGAGLHGLGNNAQLVNCVFDGNTAVNFTALGGAIIVVGGTPSIVNSTFANNHAGDNGGIRISGGTTSLALDNCIFWDNTEDSNTIAGQVDNNVLSSEIGFVSVFEPNDGVAPTVNHCDIQDYAGEWGGAGNLNADPVFLDADLRLDVTSPCLDAGDDSAVPVGVLFDLDGTARFKNAAVDMGAYESDGIPDSDGDGVADPDDNCPDDANPGQEDFDMDGIGDVCDDNDDNDGLSDADEAIAGTDPFDPDTDDDGLLDGTEVNDIGCTDPLVVDTDGDTIGDGDEVTAGTNPCEADTDGDGVPDNIDDMPLDPGVSEDLLVQMIRDTADAIGALDLGLFNGPNNNANKGRRNSLANRIRNAANALSDGDEATALDLLQGVLEKVDDVSPPPDWMDPSPEKTALRQDLEALIVLILL